MGIYNDWISTSDAVPAVDPGYSPGEASKRVLIAFWDDGLDGFFIGMTRYWPKQNHKWHSYPRSDYWPAPEYWAPLPEEPER